jgi:hypothetical protein
MAFSIRELQCQLMGSNGKPLSFQAWLIFLFTSDIQLIAISFRKIKTGMTIAHYQLYALSGTSWEICTVKFKRDLYLDK